MRPVCTPEQRALAADFEAEYLFRPWQRLGQLELWQRVTVLEITGALEVSKRIEVHRIE